ncbi:MAG: S8 family serine peptidase [Ferruginibacter sp.]
MKAILKFPLYKRTQPTNEIKDAGFLPEGSVIEVAEIVQGKAIDKISSWYKAEDGFYYWGGGITVSIDLENKTSTTFFKTTVAAKETQAWFSDTLKIPVIWNDFEAFGENVTVAVLDSGCDKNNLDIMPVLASEKFILYADSTQDILGHGTRCASLVGAHNNGNYTIGIATKCKLLIGKISNVGEINDFTSMVEGIRWAVSNGAEIISISFGKFTTDQQMLAKFYDDITAILTNKEVLIFACCGNNYEPIPASGILYPAAFSGSSNILKRPAIDKIISVGATDNKNQLAIFNLLNDYTVIHAPGENIRSYQLTSIADLDSGTSMSTPIAAAIAVLAAGYLKKKNGRWNALTLKNIILATADPLMNDPVRKIINPVKIFKAI